MDVEQTTPEQAVNQSGPGFGFYIGLAHLLLLMGVVMWVDSEHRKS